MGNIPKIRSTVQAGLDSGVAGFEDVDVFLGSMGAWKGAGHPVVKRDGEPDRSM